MSDLRVVPNPIEPGLVALQRAAIEYALEDEWANDIYLDDEEFEKVLDDAYGEEICAVIEISDLREARLRRWSSALPS